MVAVWLDDLRPMPKEYDAHARTASEAIDLLKKGDVRVISLDHDLGPPEAGNGYEVAMYILEHAFLGTLPKLEWRIHTANPVGRSNMESALLNADNFWNVIL